jgi:hypothetical protein
MDVSVERAVNRFRMIVIAVSICFLVAGFVISAMIYQIPGIGGVLASFIAVTSMAVAAIMLILGRRIARKIMESGYAGGFEVRALPILFILSIIVIFGTATAQINFQCDQNTVNTLRSVMVFASLLGIFIYIILALFGVLGLFIGGVAEVLRGVFLLQSFSVMVAPLLFWLLFLFGIDRAIVITPPQQTGDVCQITVVADQGPIALRLLAWLLKPLGLWP